MQIRKFTAVAVLATLVLATTAVAQRGDGGGQQRGGRSGGFGGMQRGGGGMMMMGQRGGGQSEVMLLARPDVQKELKITDDQKTKLTSLGEETMESMMALFPSREGRGTGGDTGTRGTRGTNGGTGTGGATGTRGERGSGGRGGFDFAAIQEDIAKITKVANTKAKVILTDTQWKRLSEIKVQVMGSSAIQDEDIKKKLKVTASQTRDLNTLTEALNTANQAIRSKMRDPNIDREALQKELEANNKLFDSELAKILTADQKKQLDTMKGKEFKLDPDYRPERGGFGGRGGGGGGG